MKKLCLIATFCLLLIKASFAGDKNSDLLISTPNEAFLFPQVLSKVKQAYKELGYNVEFEKLPAGRSILESNRLDIYDAELARVKEAEKLLPNHIRITEPILRMNVITYTLSSPLIIKQWKELESQEICSVKGLIALEKVLLPYTPVLVSQANQCIEMLIKKRIKVAVLPNALAITYNGNAINGDIKTGLTPLSDIELFHYINKKHEKLAPQLTKVFKQQNTGQN